MIFIEDDKIYFKFNYYNQIIYWPNKEKKRMNYLSLCISHLNVLRNQCSKCKTSSRGADQAEQVQIQRIICRSSITSNLLYVMKDKNSLKMHITFKQ